MKKYRFFAPVSYMQLTVQENTITIKDVHVTDQN